MRGMTAERWVRRGLGAATVVSAVAVLGIVAFLAAGAVPLLASGEAFAVLFGRWRPYAGQYGIAPMIVGSLCLAVSALALAFPVAVGICGFAYGLAPRRLGRLVLGVVHFMTSIPTVIYGFVAVFLLVPHVRQAFGAGSGMSLLTATLTLAVLILPTIVLLIHVRLQQLDPGVRLACSALGLTPAQSFLSVLVPASRRGLVAAAVLGFSRAMGDTLIALMVAGNAPQFPASPLDSVRTLTSHIPLVLASSWSGPEYRTVAAAGLLLLLLAASLTLAIRRLVGRPTPDVPHA